MRHYQEWFLSKLVNEGEVQSTQAHEKYKLVFGQNKSYKAWETFSYRIRKKMNIDAKQEGPGHHRSIWKLS